MLSAEDSDLDQYRAPSGALDVWTFCEQRLNVTLSKNSNLATHMIPSQTILCAVTAADHRDSRTGGLTGRVDR
ncbi:hypothetical protein [Nocardia sp. NPDC052316]|uniref:hypothetical protein n=1 Tax=Nocardia sp. NPDC052316 TaxID=3364329 RepID=UPI0037CBC997